MEKSVTEIENTRLKQELLKLKQREQSLERKLDKEKAKNSLLSKDLKKKDAPKIMLTNEQEQLLSSLLPDTDIQSSLSD